MAEERIQKILSRAGFGSRRDCEEYLKAGRVTVNGQKVGLGDKADAAKDQVWLDGKPVSARTELIYIALHKPRQVLSAIHQDDDRRDVLDLVKIDANLFPVGRLDYDSEGLLLLTNDGDFANKLAHPRYEHEKEYIVTIGTRPDDDQLTTWRRGVVLEDGYRTAPCRVDVIETQPKGAVLRVVLMEGRKRQIRESGERIGLPVQRIKRVRIGTILLGNLKPGEWRNLTKQEVTAMQKTELKRTPRPTQRSADATRRPPARAGARPSTRRPGGDFNAEHSGSDHRPTRSYNRSESDTSVDSNHTGERPPRRSSEFQRDTRSSAPGDRPRRSYGSRSGDGQNRSEYRSDRSSSGGDAGRDNSYGQSDSSRPRRSYGSRSSDGQNRSEYRSDRSSSGGEPGRDNSYGQSDSSRPRRSYSSRSGDGQNRSDYRSDRSSSGGDAGRDNDRKPYGGQSDSSRPRRSSGSGSTGTSSRGGFRGGRSSSGGADHRSGPGSNSSGRGRSGADNSSAPRGGVRRPPANRKKKPE